MSLRPKLESNEQPTSATLVAGQDPNTAAEHNKHNLSHEKTNSAAPTIEMNRPLSDELYDDKRNSASTNESKKKDPRKPTLSQYIQYLALPIAIVVMTAWPWIFLGVIWASHGLRMNGHVAKLVTNHPHQTTYFVTFICNIISLLVSILVSMAVVRLTRAWVNRKKGSITLFRLSVLSAVKAHSNPSWGFNEMKSRFSWKRWVYFILVVCWMVTFTTVTPAINGLIAPVPFNTTDTLSATEFDFASTATDCVNWFNNNQLTAVSRCDWLTVNGTSFTTCLDENQIVDVIESGRNRIVSSLSDDSSGAVFYQLGSNTGLQFLGPLRGVFPPVPNGVFTINTVHLPSLLSNTNQNTEKIFYNYTLDLQGLFSNISCIYDHQSPITFSTNAVSGVANASVYQYSGTCPVGASVTHNMPFPSYQGVSYLGFWACVSTLPGGEPQYSLYLSGQGDYSSSIGNITCTVSPIQPAVFPVTYESRTGFFSSSSSPNYQTNSTAISSQVIQTAILGMASVISESQNQDSNMVAESVITFGVKALGLDANSPNSSYLPLYAAMLQGVIEYEATYIRLLYTVLGSGTGLGSAPPSCYHNVTGSVTYTATGWFVIDKNIYFLLPMTLINLAALTLVIIAVCMGDKVLHDPFDPTDPRSLIFASCNPTLPERDPELPLPQEWLDCHVDYNLPKNT